MGAIGMIVAVTLLFLLPSVIINALNSTSTFKKADIDKANKKIDEMRNIIYVVIVISLIMMIGAGVNVVRNN